jgi:hypothetical protein
VRMVPSVLTVSMNIFVLVSQDLMEGVARLISMNVKSIHLVRMMPDV